MNVEFKIFGEELYEEYGCIMRFSNQCLHH